MIRPRLTERQNQVYEFVRGYVREMGRPPTIAEIGRHLALRSTSGVHKLLVTLETKGYLTRTRHEARGLVLTDDDGEARFRADDDAAVVFGIRSVRAAEARRPLVRSRVAFAVDPKLLPRGADLDGHVALIVGDDGMNGDGVRKHDLAVAEERDWRGLPAGALVGAIVRERVVVRRFEFANGRLHLRAADRTYADEAFTPTDDECFVVGPVRALMRAL